MASSFADTRERVDRLVARHPRFPHAPTLLVRLVKRIHACIQDDANGVLRPHGLNHPEYNLLMMLYGSPGGAMTPTQMARAAGEKSANITRLSDRLATQGLIARGPATDDRRKVLVRLTRKGEALIGRLLPDLAALLQRQATTLSEREMATLLRLLEKFLDGLEAR